MSGKQRTASSIHLSFETMEKRVMMVGDPFISELVALNNRTLLDQDGDDSDWIEIQNPREESADLAGWYLTDDPQALTKWRFPSTTIEAGGYLIVFASDKNRFTSDSELHTNFKLAGDGEFLALVKPDGVTVASHFGAGFPSQREDVSYGLTQTETVTPLISRDDTARILVPHAEDNAKIGLTWTGGAEPFDDSASAGWIAGPMGIGFDVEPARARIEGAIAYRVSSGTPGNQAFTGRLGKDFVVHRPIEITGLGTFDDQSDGLNSTITVELWERDDGGTPKNAHDDSGASILISQQFTARNPGILVGGNRFKSLREPVLLQPGAYTIVASGYGDEEHNGNSGGDRPFGFVATSSAISLTDAARFGSVKAETFPTFVDTGSGARYAAGTFAFVEKEAAARPDQSENDTTIAYRTLPGIGNATFEGNLGMDFEVLKPIRVTDLGVFDSGQDGISGTLAVSLWSLTGREGTQLVSRAFMEEAGAIESGTGSRFLALDEPVILPPGFYSIVASGFLGDDLYSRADLHNPLHGDVDPGDVAIQFIGTSRFSYFDSPDRFLERSHHRLPERLDRGPVNKWAAGTFQFETVIDEFIATNIGSRMYRENTSAYMRVPFPAQSTTGFDGLRLKVNFDDGFVAYLNGKEVARRNSPAAVQWNSRAQGSRSGMSAAEQLTIDISEHLDLLHEDATNILAIHGLNSRLDDPDFLLLPQLEAIKVSGFVEGYFEEPTPGAANTQSFQGFVEEVTYGEDRGFVSADMLGENGQFVVSISTETVGADIYYTVDGTEPTPVTGTLYAEPLTLDKTTILRAAAFKDQHQPSKIGTQSYIFLDDVLNQAGIPEGLPPHWNGVPADYEISQNSADLPLIAGDASFTQSEYNEAIKSSLLALPTLSIVLDPDDLFGPVEGLYANPFPRGRESEHPASIEYLLPDGGDGFQIDAGLRMMGWTSRIPSVSPKHSLRIVFRSEFGPGRLDFPFFDDIPLDSFDTLALRANSRDTWISDFPFGDDEQHPLGGLRPVASFIRDQWSRTVQSDMGQPSVAGNFVHLYLNGIYWGVYNPTERPDAAYASDHFGGNEEEFDSVTFCNPTTRATDGNLRKWNELLSRADAGLSGNASYQRIQGNNLDGTRNPDFDVLIDIDNFIDYIIAGQFDATDDWPCNFYAVRRRGPDSEGFQFITWDNDLAFPMILNDEGVPVADVNASRVDVNVFGTLISSPWRVEEALRANEEYLVRYADAVQRHLFHGGVLTPEANIARWRQIAEQVGPALIAESARWGDYRRDVDPVGEAELYTPAAHWQPFIDYMIEDFFPARTDVFVNELRSKGLFPELDAPSFGQHGGKVDAGFDLEITGPNAEIWYTLDGTNPRLEGGDVSPSAILYTEAVPLTVSSEVKARALQGGQWSAMNQALFEVDIALRVTEIMYNPAGNDDTEFIELQNTGSTLLDLTGIRLSRSNSNEGIDYEFLASDANRTLAPAQFIVIAGDREAFFRRYPDVPVSVVADRDFSGRLSNQGEVVTLTGPLGETIQQFKYDNQWHPETDDVGRSLDIIDAKGDLLSWSQRSAWRPSREVGGSPGTMGLLPGDVNGDHVVDGLDIVIVQANFGTMSSATRDTGDLDGDGAVTRLDLIHVLQNFGRNVPEAMHEGPPQFNSLGVVDTAIARLYGDD